MSAIEELMSVTPSVERREAARAELAALRAEADQLRAELAAVRHIISDLLECLPYCRVDGCGAMATHGTVSHEPDCCADCRPACGVRECDWAEPAGRAKAWLAGTMGGAP